MNAIQETEKLLATLTRAEKAQLLQWIVRDLGDAFPGIDAQPGVAGGEPCIVRTRIPVWVLEQARWARRQRSGFNARLPRLTRRGSGQCLGLRSFPSRGNRPANPGKRGCLKMETLFNPLIRVNRP